MANRWLFAGGDLGMMRVSGSPSAGTTAGTFDTTYCDHSILSAATSAIIYADFTDSSGASDSVTGTETLWFHTEVNIANNTTTANSIVALLNSSDQPWLAFCSTTSSGNYGLFYNSNTGASPTWTQISSNFAIASSARYRVDIKLTLGSPHSAEIYINEVLQASGTFTQASLTAIDAVSMAAPAAINYRFSQIMAAVGITTINGHVFYGKPSGAGANTGWTGAYTTIDDVGIDDTDLISSGSAGQKSTFTYADLPTLAAGYTIGDLFMWTRAKNDGASPTNVKPVRRDSGGTDNVGSNFSGIGTGFGEFLTRYSGVSPSEYNASEFGVESAA